MLKRNPRSWSPWKILLLAILGTAATVGFFLACGIYWMVSIRERTQINVERPSWADLGAVPPSGSELEPAKPKTENLTPDPGRPRIQQELQLSIPPAPSTNAILSRRNRDGHPYPGNDIFRDTFIPHLEIYIPGEGIAGLKRNPRSHVPAMIREGKTVYTNVAIHLKGGPGSFRPMEETPAFTVNFEKFAQGQTWHGLKKIHLNNSVQDPSFLSEKICRELFEAADVPVPRAGNALVTFNGRYMGMYVVVEGVNKQFLKRYFKDVTGNVYDGHSGTDVTDSLPTNDGDHPGDKSRLRALSAATRLPVSARLAGLEATLDLDRFLTFMAMETLLWHWDGYTVSQNNYRIFHDRTSDRMVFLPQGLDQVLSETGASIVPRTEGLVSRAVWEIPEARHRYHQRVAELATNVFRIEAITNRIQEVAGRIQAALARFESPGSEHRSAGHQQRVNSLSRRFKQRVVNIRRQLFPEKLPQLESFDNTMALTDWEARIDLGDPQLRQVQDREGKPVLQISSSNRCAASWRTRVPLENGRYQFEMRIMTRGVEFNSGDSRSGAGLRISGKQHAKRNPANTGWIPVHHDFEVRDGEQDVELVCELRANRGDIWFDLKSFRISRK